jgi:hypothetical protein
MSWALKSLLIWTRGSGAKERRLHPLFYAFAPVRGLQNIALHGPGTSFYLDLDEARGGLMNKLRPARRIVNIPSYPINQKPL